MFAATPPLETLRALISEAATVVKGKDEKVMMIADVSRAFFEADAKRKIAVKLPEEALEPGEDGKSVVGILRKSLYGARGAAINFQNEVK